MSRLHRSILTSIALLVGTTLSLAGCRSPQVAPLVDPTSVRSVKVGMTQKEVIALLGHPLRIRPWGEGAEVYDYAIPGWSAAHPSLWIAFERGAVRTVQAKSHKLLGEDTAVYEVRADQPAFETPEFESLFRRR